jgi:oxygen-dependent protoporphyrinogen oxidase
VLNRHGAAPMPAAGLLGIPVTAWSADVRRAVGLLGAVRAAVGDRLPRRLGIHAGAGRTTSLGRLVRTRMGTRVLRDLVAPVVSGVYAADPDRIDVDAAAPGLRDALARHGTLAKAVGSLRAAAPPGSLVAGLAGGMTELVLALEADLRARGVQLRTGTPAIEIRRIGQTWLVRAEGVTARAGVVMVCTPGDVAARLLATEAPSLTRTVGPVGDVGTVGTVGTVGIERATEPAPGPAPIVLATLVLRAPELDRAPRGTGVLVAREVTTVAAKAMTHGTAKWSWLREAAGPGRHVIRLSYGRAGEESRVPTSDDEFAALALRDASQLLGVELTTGQLEGFARTEWPDALPAPLPGQRALAVAAREELRGLPGIEVAGAWIAGSGLAAVVADAERAVALLLARISG